MKKILQSKRLIIRPLHVKDSDFFYIMMSDPKVMNPIPQSIFNRKDSDSKLLELMKSEPLGKKMVWAITELNSNELIGICGFLINSDNNAELAYRFRPDFWGKGYGSEIAQHLIKYGFNTLKYLVIDADVYSENIRSIKILEKYMNKVNKFWNENDQCFDIRYRLKKEEYTDQEKTQQ